ncbi:hypothetical protein C0Q70_02859 [Pomacea canaliculata]|uniref:Uncharacterized protein n=1 Tax=Pomacea canaliculata TaxID=400727 RepID=A0A2T7PR74_POMCA|nr:hypothetical protein C0Q70_02859 [Pomacea canaliculata]
MSRVLFASRPSSRDSNHPNNERQSARAAARTVPDYWREGVLPPLAKSASRLKAKIIFFTQRGGGKAL